MQLVPRVKQTIDAKQLTSIIEALTALVGRLSLSEPVKKVLNGDIRLFHLTLNFL